MQKKLKDKLVEKSEKRHFCDACCNDFEVDNEYGYLMINGCCKFVGEKMDLRKKTGLNQLDLYNMKKMKLENLKLPNRLKILRFMNLPYVYVNLENLKLPDNNEQMLLICIDNDEKNVIIKMLIKNGYYDEKYLHQNEQDERTIRYNYACTFKRRCINLNWLFDKDCLWDWHLNIVIDNYCGFEIFY